MGHRKSSEIRGEINYLNPILAERITLSEFYPEDEALKISANQLIQRRDELIKEFQDAAHAEYNNTYTMKIEGDRVFNGSVPATILSRIVGAFQDSVTAIANRQTKGEQSRGRISQEIARATEINVSVSAVGSYQIVFTSGIPSILPGEKASLQMQAMQALSDAINSNDGPEGIRKFKTEMGPRVFNKYKSMMEVLCANNVSLTLFEGTKNIDKVEVSSEKAGKILSSINSLKGKPDEEILVEGRVIDIDFDRGVFVISTSKYGEINCKENHFPEKIKLINNLDRYSMRFTVKRTYNEARDYEMSKYIALDFKVVQQNAYLDTGINE